MRKQISGRPVLITCFFFFFIFSQLFVLLSERSKKNRQLFLRFILLLCSGTTSLFSALLPVQQVYVSHQFRLINTLQTEKRINKKKPHLIPNKILLLQKTDMIEQMTGFSFLLSCNIIEGNLFFQICLGFFSRDKQSPFLFWSST